MEFTSNALVNFRILQFHLDGTEDGQFSHLKMDSVLQHKAAGECIAHCSDPRWSSLPCTVVLCANAPIFPESLINGDHIVKAHCYRRKANLTHILCALARQNYSSFLWTFVAMQFM